MLPVVLRLLRLQRRADPIPDATTDATTDADANLQSLQYMEC